MNPSPAVHLSACSWELPDYAGHASLPEALRHFALVAAAMGAEPLPAKDRLGRESSGMLMTLGTAEAALQRAGLSGDRPDPAFGVVVACNTGGLDAVCNAAQTIRDRHVEVTAWTDLPSTSSNAVAWAVATRFGLQGLNLTICSGSNASFDALVMAANAIRNQRAERMLVIGVETDGPVLRRLMARGGAHPALLEGALAVVLESAASVHSRGAASIGTLGDYAFVHADAASLQPLRALLERHAGKTVYAGAPGHMRQAVREGHDVIDIGAVAQRGYGSATLLQLVHHLESRNSSGAVILGGGGWQDRRAGVLVVNGAEQ